MMNTLPQLRIFDWRVFLETWSQEFIASVSDLDSIPTDVVESGWLGYPGATEEQIIQVETRLEISLPPSYRDFLKVSNGWRQMTPFIYRVWSVEEVDWFVSRHHIWIDTFIARQLKPQKDTHTAEASANGAYRPHQVPDSEYLLYDETQDCSKIRYEYLHTALEISDKGESSIYLLNPQIKTSDGEWEAWFFGDWLPGADRYPSFRHMMEAEYANFLEMKEIL
ncbi:MAG: SMI1/KNR4 family protein [Leptolyngbyaceae cyanobacterium]